MKIKRTINNMPKSDEPCWITFKRLTEDNIPAIGELVWLWNEETNLVILGGRVLVDSGWFWGRIDSPCFDI